MKQLIILAIFCIAEIYAKISFLQIPAQLKAPSHFINLNVTEDFDFQEDEDDDLNAKQILNAEELQDLRSVVSVLDNYEVHDTFYDPLSNNSHRTKRATNSLSNFLTLMVDKLEKMSDTQKTKAHKSYFEEALELLDDYLDAVKEYRDRGEKNALQIFKQDEYNLILVNCGGWVWYPVYKVKKVLHCNDGNLMFLSRGTEKVRVCDDYYCKNVNM